MLPRPFLTLASLSLLAISFIPGEPENCAASRRGNYVKVNPDPHPERNDFSIQGPTLIGFFPPVGKEQMEDPYADGLDTLAYLLLAISHTHGCLKAIEPEVRIVLNDELRFHWEGATTSIDLSPDPARGCGVYLLKPDSGWRVVYSTADPDSFARLIAEAAAGYFGVPECSANFRHRPRAAQNNCEEPVDFRALYEENVPKGTMQKMWDAFPYDAITLERGSCGAWCPAYRVTLHRGGGAEWSGFLSSERNGEFQGEVWITDYAKLCYLLQRQRFDHLPPRYVAGGSYASSCVIRAVENGRSTVVSDYGKAGPKELAAIQQAIDAVAERISWKRR